MSELVEAIEQVVESIVRGHVNTAIPARVTAVKEFADKQMVDVEPLIHRKYDDGTDTKPPTILNVPLIFPSAGGGLLSFPVQENDGVLLVFSMRDMDNWSVSSGEESTVPESKRTHSLTDAIAIPGLYTTVSNLSPNTTDVELKFAGSRVRMKPTGDVEVNAVGDIDLVSAQDININATGAINMTSTSLSHNGTNVGDTHVHGGVQTGGSNTAGPQ